MDRERDGALHGSRRQRTRCAASRRQLPVELLVQPVRQPGGAAVGVRHRERAGELYTCERQARDRCVARESRRQALRHDGLRQHLDQRTGAGLPRHAALVQGAHQLPLLSATRNEADVLFLESSQFRRCAGEEGTGMILGMTTFTAVHVVLSLIGILSGVVVLSGLLTANPMNGLTLLFLATTVVTSLTGFFLPIQGTMPEVDVRVQ